MSTRYSTGLKNARLTNNSYPKLFKAATTISFGDGTGTGGADQILDSGNGLVAAGYQVGDYISVSGSTSNNVNGMKISAVAVGAIDAPAGSFTTESAGDAVVLAVGAGGGSLDELLRNGVIEVYTGAQPASADDGETGTKLLRVTLASGAFVAGTATNGLNLATAVAGVSSKESAETWSGVGLAAGTAGWFRYYSNAYETGLSTTAIRVDGACGVTTGELRMSSTTVAVGAVSTVSAGTVTAA